MSFRSIYSILVLVLMLQFIHPAHEAVAHDLESTHCETCIAAQPLTDLLLVDGFDLVLARVVLLATDSLSGYRLATLTLISCRDPPLAGF